MWRVERLIQLTQVTHTGVKMQNPRMNPSSHYSLSVAGKPQFKISFKRSILSRQLNCCWYCGIQMSEKTSQYDHVIPQDKGGGHEKENIVLCCKPCNSGKCNRSLDEFREHLRLRTSVLGGLITLKQLYALVELGISLPISDEYKFHFEKTNKMVG